MVALHFRLSSAFADDVSASWPAFSITAYCSAWAASGEPIVCQTMKAIAVIVSMRNSCRFRLAGSDGKSAACKSTSAVRAGQVVVVIVPDEDAEFVAVEAGERGDVRRAANAVLMIASSGTGGIAFARPGAGRPSWLNMRKTFSTGRSMPLLAARGTRRKAAGPQTRTPR